MEYTGMAIQPHKAIVGANAFAHESGIHQDGMLKNKSTYEIIEPSKVGIYRAEGEAGIVMGKHSGRHALKTRMTQLGVDLDGDELMEVFNRFKLVAEQKNGGVSDDDLMAILSDELYQPTEIWKLLDLQVVAGTRGMPTATVKLQGPDGMPKVHCAVGTGPVDAAYKAVDLALQLPVELTSYTMDAVTKGINAMATTKVAVAPVESMLKYDRTFTGSGTDTDVVVSSVRAYINALNKMIAYVAQRQGQETELGSSGDSYSSVDLDNSKAAAV